MNNLINAYTKIKLRLGNEIIVTYYSGDGKKITEKVKLLDIFEFSYICVMDDNGLNYLHFFDYDMMIESIKACNSNSYLYYNPYIKNDIFDRCFIKTECLYDIKRKVLGYDKIDFDSVDYKIEDYLANGYLLKYDDLFFSEKQREEFDLFFNMLVDELKMYAKKNGMDYELRQVSLGTTSIIYEIGDKVVKIGKPRRKNMIPYFEYLLQPIFNKLLDFDGYPIWVEVTQKVFVLENKDGAAMDSKDKQFNEIVNELKKIINSIGLKSKDLHAGNVGILLDDNKIHYDEINFDIGDDDTTSISNNNNLKILKKGNFVIIDLDCLEIKNINKYSDYLRSIGYDENKILELNSKYRRKIKKN